MRDYIISVISAALLSGIGAVIAPQNQRRYVGLVSGMVILCTIIAPVSRADLSSFFDGFKTLDIEYYQEDGEETRRMLTEQELSKRISSDIEERLREEFGVDVKASAKIGFDETGKITGVKAIETNKKISEAAMERLREVYGVEEIRFTGSH